MNSEEQIKMMAAAIYEIRILLSSYLGSKNEGDPSVRLAAHLSYALHNQAEEFMDGKTDFDLESAYGRIKGAEKIVGYEFANNGRFLKK